MFDTTAAAVAPASAPALAPALSAEAPAPLLLPEPDLFASSVPDPLVSPT